MQQNKRVLSGNNYVVMFDNQPIGLCQSVDMKDDYAPEAVSGIGDIRVAEYVPTVAKHTITVEEMMLRTASMQKLGIASENGDAVLKGNVFDIVVVNKDDGSVLRKYVGCSYASGGIAVKKHAVIASNATFNATDVTNG